MNCVPVTISLKAKTKSTHTKTKLYPELIQRSEIRLGGLRFDTKKSGIEMGLPIRSQCHPERLLSFRGIWGYSSRMIDDSKLSKRNDKSFAYSQKHARKTISVGKRKNIVKYKDEVRTIVDHYTSKKCPCIIVIKENKKGGRNKLR
jgi:hypothetical protein